MNSIQKILFAPATFAFFLLSGCAVVDAVHLATIIVDPRTHVIARSGVYPVEGRKVHYLEFDERKPIWAEPCNYDGIVVEYSENSEDGHNIGKSPGEEEPHGYAILIYQMRCPGKAAQSILSTTENTDIPYRGQSAFVDAGQGFNVGEYFVRAPENRPKWMHQVIRTVQSEAAWNPAAKSFLQHVPIDGNVPQDTNTHSSRP